MLYGVNNLMNISFCYHSRINISRTFIMIILAPLKSNFLAIRKLTLFKVSTVPSYDFHYISLLRRINSMFLFEKTKIFHRLTPAFILIMYGKWKKAQQLTNVSCSTLQRIHISILFVANCFDVSRVILFIFSQNAMQLKCIFNADFRFFRRPHVRSFSSWCQQ